MESITSRSNPLCAHLRKLAASVSYRREQGQFLCDSPKLLEEILQNRPELLRLAVVAQEHKLPPLPAEVRCVQVSASVMEAMSPAKTPQGVLAVCAIPDCPLPERLSGGCYAVLDGVQDPGNVGTVLRTADALGADALLCVNGCADLYSPKTVRASMGAVLRLPVWQCDPPELGALLRRSGIPLYGAALQPGGLDVRRLPAAPIAVAVGSEGRGLSSEVLSLCDGTVRIPMRAHCESLNAAAAAAVLLWELARRG